MSGPAYFSGGMNIAKNWDWVQAFILQDTEAAPIDLTGSVLKLMIRKRDVDHEAIVAVSSDDEGFVMEAPALGTTYTVHSILITDPEGGAFTVQITRDKLARLYPGAYVADLVRYRPDGFTERLWDAAPVDVVEGVTR